MSGKYLGNDDDEDRDYEEDITMTQEELADNIRWEESPGVKVPAQEAAKPVVAIRGPIVTMKSLPKKSSRKLKAGAKSTSVTSIDDIIGMLGKRKTTDSTEQSEELDKENTLCNTEDQLFKSRRDDTNDEADTIDTLSAGTIDSLTTLDPETLAEPAAQLTVQASNPPAVTSSMTVVAPAHTAAPLNSSVAAAVAAPMARTVSYQNQVIPGTQTWDPAQSGFGYDSGSSMRGFGYTSGTGTARPTPPEDPLRQSRSRVTSNLGASVGYGGGGAQQAQQAQYAPVLTRAPSLQPTAMQHTVQPALDRSKSVQPLQHKPQPAPSYSVAQADTSSSAVPGGYSGYQPNSMHRVADLPERNANMAPNSMSTLVIPQSRTVTSVPLQTKPHNGSTATAAVSYQLHHPPQQQQPQQPQNGYSKSTTNSNISTSTNSGYGYNPSTKHVTTTYTTSTLSQPHGLPQPSLPLSQPAHAEVVLSEEALAQLFALEQSIAESNIAPLSSAIVPSTTTTGYASTSVSKPAVSTTAFSPAIAAANTTTDHPLTLSEADLAHLLELEQAYELSQSQPNNPMVSVAAPVVPWQAAMGSNGTNTSAVNSTANYVDSSNIASNNAHSSVDMTHLSEDVMAQLLALEESAYAEMATPAHVVPPAPPAPPAAIYSAYTVPNKAFTGSTPAVVPIPAAMPSTTTSTCIPVQVTPAPVETPLLCMRLVALDVVDDPNRRLREVRAFQPGTTEDPSTINNNNNQTRQAQQQSEIGGTLLTVELTGDWYNCQLVSGDIFHIIDMGPTPNTNITTTNNNNNNTNNTNNNTSIPPIPPPSSVFTHLAAHGIISVSDAWGLVVTHPDILISPTKIAESCNCIRRGVLTDRIRSFGDISAPAVLGNLKHAFIEALTEKVLEILQSFPGTSHPPPIAVIRHKITPNMISGLIDDAKSALMEDLYLVGCSDESVATECSILVNPTISWVYEMFVQGVVGMAGGGLKTHNSNANNNNISNVNGNPNNSNNPNNLNGSANKKATERKEDYFLRRIDAAEETVWCGLLGMKGQVDMVATARWVQPINPSITTNNINNTTTNANGSSNGSSNGQNSSVEAARALTVQDVQLLQDRALPVEIKTGKWRAGTVLGHRAQVILYVLMMTVRDRGAASIASNDRPGIPQHGVIVYLSAEETKVDLIQPHWTEMCALVASRNKLATFIRDSSSAGGAGLSGDLPPLLQSVFDCSYCYQAAECLVTHAATEAGTAISSGVSELFSYVLTDITSSQLSYYKHWDELLTLEATATGSVNLPWASGHHSSTNSSNNSGDKCMTNLVLQSCTRVDSGTSDTTTGGGNSNYNKGKSNYMLTFTCTAVPLVAPTIATSGNSAQLLQLIAHEEYSPASISSTTALSVNDRVHVSVETDLHYITHNLRAHTKNRHTNHTTTSVNATDAIAPDIEDIGLTHFRSHSRAVTSTEPNVCSGSVVSVSPTEVCVLVSEEPRRLNKLYSSNNSNKGGSSKWKFRLDKDEIAINITTMRSNLLALFVEPHNPKKYQAHQQAAKTQHKNNNNNTSTISNNKGSSGLVGYRTTSTSSLHSFASVSTTTSTTNASVHDVVAAPTPRNTRWRSLIVDLSPPAFKPPGNTFQEDIFLMRPSHMAPASYRAALQMLSQYQQLQAQKNNQMDGLQLSKQQLQELCGHVPEPAHNNYLHNNNPNPNSFICVSKGSAGELHIFGGLTVYPGCNPSALCQEFSTLNPGQAAAVRKVLLAEDYSLLLGLPGTGKTSTLSLVVRMMLARGQKVLLTSFTNSAVDHLMLKLVEAGMTSDHIMRLGSRASVHPAAQRFVRDPQTAGTSLQALQQHCALVRLVACTVLTASRNQLVRRLDFDCCVMDEAGQIAQPAALGAVLCARTCVLVGDDYQLPPLVVSLEAQANGMNVSLFKRFMEAHPAAVCSLTAQYRMNDDIMSVCNALIYEHRMQCASLAVASARMVLPCAHLIPLPGTMRSLHPSAAGPGRSDWLFAVLQPNPAVTFINTDSLSGYQSTTPGTNKPDPLRGNSVSNPTEATIVQLLVTALRAAKFDLKNVGVICPFRAQVELIASTLSSTLGEEVLRECEVSTVDKYQGRDKDVVILSTVKCNSDGKDSVGNLLRDWRRINVAITRAKHKLIVIGSFGIMQQVPVLQKLTQLTQQRNWTLNLPADALKMYQL